MWRIACASASLLACVAHAQTVPVPAATLYACHAESINEALVRQCSVHPSFTKSAEEALKQWKSMYGQRAKARAQTCTAPMEANLKAHLQQLRAAANQPEFCRTAIQQLRGGPGTAEDRIWESGG